MRSSSICLCDLFSDYVEIGEPTNARVSFGGLNNPAVPVVVVIEGDGGELVG